MSRFAQWLCGLAAVGTLGYAAFLVSVIDPALLVMVWETGRLPALLAIPVVFGTAWLGLWRYRGRPGRRRTGAAVVGAVAVLVAGASVWFHAVHGGAEVHEVEPTPGSVVQPSPGSDSPGLPPPPTAAPSPSPG